MDEAKIRRLRHIVLMNNLERDERFDKTPVVKLSYVYNGAGPDSWEPRHRRALTRLLKKFEPPFMVHDWDFEYLKHNYDNFVLANDRLENNCTMLIWKKYGAWYHWLHRRYYLNALILVMLACRSYKGLEAWEAAAV